jgi:hypothetical protein
MEKGREVNIVTFRKNCIVKNSTPEEFFTVFLANLNTICELINPGDVKVLAHLCAFSGEDGKISLSTKTRKEILAKLSYSSSAFSNSLARLKISDVVVGENGDYEVNPQFFFDGTLEERTQLLRDKNFDLLLRFRIYQ